MGSKKRSHMSGKRFRIAADGVERQVFARLEAYRNLSFLEQYALFIGKAQLLELMLKHLLARRFGHDFDTMGNLTLGRATRELKNIGIRIDYTSLLDRVVEYRNYIAHELLVNEAILDELLDGYTGRLEYKRLEQGASVLELSLVLFDLFESYDAWHNDPHPDTYPAPTNTI